jgi:hypothetical protein
MKITIDLEVNDQMCSDILTTAVEGGSSYWAIGRKCVRNAERSVTYIEVADAEDSPREWHPVSLETVRAGIQRLLSRDVEYGNRDGLFADLMMDELGVRTDAGDADCVVQAGIFGKIVYG